MVLILDGTICPRSSDRFYIVSYYIKCATTPWTHNNSERGAQIGNFIYLFRLIIEKADFSEHIHNIASYNCMGGGHVSVFSIETL